MKKKTLFILGCLVYLLALILSIHHNQISIKPGYLPKYIGHTTDPLKPKKVKP
jgi:hypothetical protein